MPGKNTYKDQIKEITDSIERHIQELFNSERYRQYLRTMGQFHRYSFNNSMLIFAQRPNATRVASFSKWKQLGRSVMKGEKGLRILAPSPYNKTVSRIKRDPNTGKTVMDAEGNPVREDTQVRVMAYRPVFVFDVSQTTGKPLPTLAADLKGNVKQFEIFMEALRRSAPVPIEFKPMDESVDGYFNAAAQNIAIREGMSEVQTVSAAIHEIAHAKLHNYEKAQAEAVTGDGNAEQSVKKDRRTEEVEAESVSYAVCQYYGIETGENSVGYIASWSKDKSLPELRSSLETINKTSAELIDDIDRNFREICKERGIEFAEREAAAKDAFSIYQLKDGDQTLDYRFEPLDSIHRNGLSVDPANYELVYRAPLTPGEGLEDIYTRFNIDRPKDFTGHSLSVSDIIALCQNGVVSYHYCDSIGFRPLPDFHPDHPENYLRNAEMTVEDDYGMIDGIINNGPKQSVLAQLHETQEKLSHRENAPTKSKKHELEVG